MTTADQSAQVTAHDDHASIEARLAELERERQEMRDHRTQIRTLLSLAGAVAVWLQSFGGGGATSVTGTLTIRAVLR